MRYQQLICTCVLTLLASFNASAKEVVNVYNWSGYMPDAVLLQFEKETGIKVNYSTYESNETLYAKLKANSQAGYDVVVPSTYFIDRMRKQDMLQPIDKSQLTHFNNLNLNLLNKEFDPHNQYSVPFLWSATAITVNSNYWPKESFSSWNDLWRTEYRDQLLVLDDTREVFSVALMALGYSPNDTNPKHIHQAYLKLKELMPNVKLFNSEAAKAIYLDEDVTLGMGWSGDIYLANQKNPALHYIYPKEGFIIALDSMAIPKNAKHLANAYKFIDFILRADIAAKISAQTGYATANEAGVKLLPTAVRENQIIYPNASIMQHGKFQTDAGASSEIYEKYFQLLKIGG